jgi:purine nucleoside permease
MSRQPRLFGRYATPNQEAEALAEALGHGAQAIGEMACSRVLAVRASSTVEDCAEHRSNFTRLLPVMPLSRMKSIAGED